MIGNLLSRSIFTKSIVEELYERLTEKGWRVTPTSRIKNRPARLFDMVSTAWINRQQYSGAHIVVYSGLAFLYAEAVGLVLRMLKKPFLLTLHGGNLPAFSLRWPSRVSNLLNLADLVGTPSFYIKNKLQQFREDIIYLPNGISLDNYYNRLRVGPIYNMVWLRAFHKIYNPVMAIRTLALLATEYPDIQLQMTGPDKGDGSLQEVKNLAEQLGVGNNLQITLGIPKGKVPSHLSGHDIFLNTTNYESFGVSVMEAAASGMCIVTTNVGELPYLWQHDHDALLVPPDDSEAMAAAVRRILTESGLAERLSRNARKKAEQFDWSIILPQWEALFTEVIQKSQQRLQKGESRRVKAFDGFTT